jgi:hypothetical protein
MLSTNVMQFANFSRNVYRKKLPNYYVENIAEKTLRKIFVAENCFFNGQFTKIQAIKSSLQQRFSPIAGLALAILCFVENNLVTTILSFKEIQ